jgi:ArsR family transcriptional regulator, arsenate/arsenite/antimonite-responsive transcriptional repressor / arsenate reductase (thioredoxin)
MASRDIDITGRSTKSLSRYLNRRFDRVITLCDKVREVCPEFPGAPITSHWSIPDPATRTSDPATTHEVFDRVADEIDRRVTSLLADLTTPPHGS